MKLGISSYTYPWSVGVGDEVPTVRLHALDLLARAQALDVQVLQLADGLDLHRLSQAELDEILHKADALGIALEVGTRATTQQQILDYVRVARQLRSPFLRAVVYPEAARTPDRQINVAEMIDLIRDVLPELQRNNVVLAIETHESLLAKELRAIIEQTNPRWVGVVFDTANSLGCFETAEMVFAELREYILNFHAKDVTTRRSGHSLGFVIEGTPAGRGKIDLAGLIAATRLLPHDCNVIVEHWVPSAGTLAATMAKEQAWAEESVNYLRHVLAGT